MESIEKESDKFSVDKDTIKECLNAGEQTQSETIGILIVLPFLLTSYLVPSIQY